MSELISNQEKQQQLANSITDFVIQTLAGQLSGAYKCAIEQKNVSILKNFKTLYPMLSTEYLNAIYFTLIKKNDASIVASFIKFKSFCSHSEVCLIHIIKLICESIVNLFDFEKCNFANYKIFMTTCNTQLSGLKEQIKNILPTHLSHECLDIDISTCDPNEKLFTVEISDSIN